MTQLPWLAALVITDAMFENTVLIEFATPGIIAPAATATKPAIRAYSMRSWPLVSCQSLNFQAKFVSIFNCLSSLNFSGR